MLRRNSLLCIILCGCASLAHGESQLKSPPNATSSTLELFNPVALIGQALVSLTGADDSELDVHDAGFSPSVLERAALMVSRSEMTVHFGGDDAARVSLVLADSQLRVRLARDVLLRCEVSSRDIENTDAELAFDLGIQFRFK